MSNHSKPSFGLWYDFRNPAPWDRPFTDIYSETLDQIVWAEDNGFDDVWIQEHHFHDDGFCSSVIPVCAAIASRTKRIQIGTAVMLMPFHNPVRVAEDCATIDIISGGRFRLGVGTGYVVEEFEKFDISKSERGARTDEGLEIIRRLWEGVTLDYKGRFFNVRGAKLSPGPVRKPRPPILVGGFSPAGVKRAARYGDGFLGTGPLKDLYDQYKTELVNLGKPVSDPWVAGGYFWLMVSDDPEKSWNEAADHVLYQLNSYASWFEKAGMPLLPHIRDINHLRELGLFNVVDVDTCVRMIREYIDEVPVKNFYSFTVPPGMSAKWVQPHLELFAEKVIPEFR